MAWGRPLETKDERERREGRQRGNTLLSALKKTLIVFVTSSKSSRSLCHLLCEHDRMKFNEFSIAHNATHQSLSSLIPNTNLVVIGTCRESLDRESVVQEREKFVCELAREHHKPVALFANEDDEVVQDHLAWARGMRPLVIVPVHNGHFGEGFMDCFPIGTQFLERGDAPAFLEQTVIELLKRAK